MPENTPAPGSGRGIFTTTHWSVVLAAGDSQSPESREALETLCRTYWYPIYATVRALGAAPDQAQDLTQGFFVELLDKSVFKAASPERGRFRSFLKGALRHYRSRERERERAHKRGGGVEPLSLDFEDAESRYRLEIRTGQTPDSLFERRWARALLSRALERLRAETRGSGDGDRLRRLEPLLTGQTPQPKYGEIATELGITESAVKSAVHRMRGRFGNLVRDEVAQTVKDPKEVDDELRHLFAALE